MNLRHDDTREGERLRHELSSRLLSERAALRARLSDLRAAQTPAGAEKSGPGEVDGTAAVREVETALEEQFESRLAAVETALERVDAGWLGSCARCESAIPLERLLAVPGTEHCVSCQDRLARQHRA